MQIYRVGGCVRDQLLGIEHQEIDWVVVGGTPEEMIEMGFRPVGKDFPVFLHPETHEEYALARTERKTAKGHQGFSFYAAPDVSLEDDLARRDLTINAMAMDDNGEIIDPYQGQKDLESRILRHVTDAFAEDPLRVYRVARFMARFADKGFTIAPETLDLMKKIVAEGELEHLSKERVWQETVKALVAPTPAAYFETLKQCNALKIHFSTVSDHEIAILSRNSVTPTKTETQKELINIRFSCISLNGKIELPVPNQTADMAKLVREYHEQLANLFKLPVKEVLDILIHCDAFRRPERFLTASSASLIITDQSNPAALTPYEKLLEAVNNIDIEPLKRGYSGKALGEMINTKRLEAIEHFAQ